MFAFSPDTINTAYNKLKNVKDNFGGLIVVLSELPEIIHSNQVYRISVQNIQKKLCSIFDVKERTIITTDDHWTIVFSNDWARRYFSGQLVNKVDLLSMAVFCLRRFCFEKELTSNQVIDLFVKKLHLQPYLNIWFSNDEHFLLKFNQEDVKTNQSLFISGISGFSSESKSLSFMNPAGLKSSATELTRGAQIQTLYSANEMAVYFLFNKQDLSQFYSFSEETHSFNDTDLENSRLSFGSNILLYGVPGSGKSYTIEHEYCQNINPKNVERLVFHPDYTYSDFVGQILPKIEEDNDSRTVTYEFTPGPFTNILCKAYRNPLEKFVLIIEEINRGNAPAIFGEIFQLLDRKIEVDEGDNRFPVGTSEYGITNENVAKIVYDDKFHKVRIPSNLTLIATMNTSDQNVFTLDTAFQRRWQMRLVENSFEHVDKSLAQAHILDTDVTWEKFCTTINRLILDNKAQFASSEDKRLGVFFVHKEEIVFDSAKYNRLIELKKLNQLDDKEEYELDSLVETLRRFPEKVIKYLWDDVFKFNPEIIFDTSKCNNLESVIRTFLNVQGRNRFDIFKESFRNELFSTEAQQ